MNNSYVVENGKVFVSNQDGLINEREYDDNIKQILIEENILESIQNEIKEIEQYDIHQSKTLKKIMNSKIPYVTLFSLATFGLVVLLPSSNPNSTMVLIGDVVAGLSCTSLGICGDVFRYKMNKNQKKREERYSALKELEEKQKSKIESLKKEKNKNDIKANVESITLDHSKEEEIINRMVQEYIDSLSTINSTMEEQGPVKKLTR